MCCTKPGPCDHAGVNEPPVSTTPSEFAAARYRALAEGLGELYGKPRQGWKTRVAKRLGVSPSYLSRVLSGDRVSIGVDVIEEAVRRVPIARSYFAPSLVPGERPEDVVWRDFVATDPAAADEPLSSEERTRSSYRWSRARELARMFMRTRRDSAQGVRAIAEEILRDPVVSAAVDVRDAGDDEQALARGFKLIALLEHDETAVEAAEVDPQHELVEPAKLRVRARIDPTPETAPRLPWPGAPGRYVGWRRATPSDPPSTRVRFTTNGPEYVNQGVVEVPDSPYFRRALEKRDLLRA